MRALIAVLMGITLSTCFPSQHNDARYGTVRVAIDGCLDTQRQWIAAELDALDALGPTWRLALSSETPEVTVRCTEFPTYETGAGRYRIGDDFVEIDPGRITSESQTKAAAGHELFHAYVWMHSPHMERATYHVCWYARNETPPANCHPTLVAQDALMNPSLGGAPSFDGEDIVDGLAQNVPTQADIDLFNWAMSETP